MLYLFYVFISSEKLDLTIINRGTALSFDVNKNVMCYIIIVWLQRESSLTFLEIHIILLYIVYIKIIIL